MFSYVIFDVQLINKHQLCFYYEKLPELSLFSSCRMSLKGLNTPQIIRDADVDNLFRTIKDFLDLDDKSQKDAITQIYEKLPCSIPSPVSKLEAISTVMNKSFEFIEKIQDYSLRKEAENKASKDKERHHLITISLHDMKYFNQLINLIIVQGIYPFLPQYIGIPLEQRRLKSFSNHNKLFQYQKVKDGNQLLDQIATNLERIFDRGGDIKDLLLKGSGYTDLITILLVLSLEYNPQKVNALYKLEAQNDTYNLFNIYTVLLQTTRSPKYKAFLSERLSFIMINRENGVSSLIDFVVGIRDDEEINIEKFDNVNKILLSKPKNVPSTEYFTKIFDQIYEILVMINRPVSSSAAVNFIQTLYNKNKNIVHDFLFKRIWTVLDFGSEETGNEVLVTGKELNNVINVLISLSKDTSIEFLNQLFSKIILTLWTYFFYLKKNELAYSSIIMNILVSFFTITSNNQYLEEIILNLINFRGDDWEFQTNITTKLTSVVRLRILNKNVTNEDILKDIDSGLDSIVELLKNLGDDIVRFQFLAVLNRWILKYDNNESILKEDNPFLVLLDLKFIEKINQVFKDSLLEKPEEILQVIKNLLKVNFDDDADREVDSDDEEEEEEEEASNSSEILLQLLSAIISETNPTELFKYKSILKDIAIELSKNKVNKQFVSLNTRIEELLNNEPSESDLNDEESQDKALLEKAITSINDPLVPIRAHGLHLLRQLIIKKSNALTLDFVIELHIVQLQDPEPFIYLNVIKSLNELIELNRDGTVDVLVELYAKNEEKLEDRLKIGEVLLNFISKSGQVFTGELANKVMSTSLNIVRDFQQDNRIRMSSMSLIGQALKTNAIGLDEYIKDSLDCSIGILEMETDPIMKRSAVVLVSDLLAFGGLEIVPKGYGSKLQTVLKFNKANANDYLLVEQIDQVLAIIEDLIQDKINPSVNNSQFGSLKITEL